jgi:hypothetical protein
MLDCWLRMVSGAYAVVGLWDFVLALGLWVDSPRSAPLRYRK